MTNAKELDKIRKSLEVSVKEKSRENIIMGLAELQVLIDEPRYGFRDAAFEIQESVTHDLLELNICKDIEDVDKLFKEVDIIKKQIEKEPKFPKEKLTKRERIDRDVKKLEKAGLAEAEAVAEVERRELAKSGLVRCPLCGDYINLKHGFGAMAPVIELGITYHLGCLEKARKLEHEIAMGEPMMREGMEVYCSLCHEPIMVGQAYFFECPPDEDWEVSAECKYYHNELEPPYNCWKIYYAEKIKKENKK